MALKNTEKISIKPVFVFLHLNLPLSKLGGLAVQFFQFAPL